MESEAFREMLDLGRGERFGERVCDHISSRTIHKAHRAILHHPTDEMVAHVDVLRARMVLVVVLLQQRRYGMGLAQQRRVRSYIEK